MNLQADEFPTLTTNSPTTSLAYQSSKHPALNVNEPQTEEEIEYGTRKVTSLSLVPSFKTS